jgi:hypothetical protein
VQQVEARYVTLLCSCVAFVVHCIVHPLLGWFACSASCWLQH